MRRRLTEATDRVRQLEEDLLGVTQRGLQKETELDWLVENAQKHNRHSSPLMHLGEDTTPSISGLEEDFFFS